MVDRQWTVGSDTLVWNIHQEAGTGECVLDLKSGAIPGYEIPSPPDPPTPYTLTPWYMDQSVTKLVVSGKVSATECWRLFYGLSNLTYADVGNLDVSTVRRMGGMFHMDIRLKTIVGLEYWDVSNLDTTDWMFGECHSLVSLDLSSWNLSSV